MHRLKSQFFWLTVWGICFGLLEAAFVFYLRRIYYPDGFQFPALLMLDPVMKVELAREAVTVIMLWAAAELTRKTRAGKIAVFMFLFGVWDIFYYIFLKIMAGWPESLGYFIFTTFCLGRTGLVSGSSFFSSYGLRNYYY